MHNVPDTASRKMIGRKTMAEHTLVHDPLDPRAAEELVHGRHGRAADVLGPHPIGDGGDAGIIVRAFLPGARAAWVIPPRQENQDGR